jgi:ribonuclease HI
METYSIHFDGSCWPNPGGTAAYGTIVKSEGETICAEAGVIDTSPVMSNNVAEFFAVAVGLKRLVQKTSKEHRKGVVSVYGDSQIVINIMARKWRPNPDKLYYTAYLQAEEAVKEVRDLGLSVSFTWIPREANTECDELSKEHNHAIR